MKKIACAIGLGLSFLCYADGLLLDAACKGYCPSALINNHFVTNHPI